MEGLRKGGKERREGKWEGESCVSVCVCVKYLLVVCICGIWGMCIDVHSMCVWCVYVCLCDVYEYDVCCGVYMCDCVMFMK